MVNRQPSLEQLEQGLRMEICSTCPYRTARVKGQGIRRACEDNCPLFVHLPTLKDRAQRLDPMVGDHHKLLLALMREIIENTEAGRGSAHSPIRRPLRRHHRRAAKILARLINA